MKDLSLHSRHRSNQEQERQRANHMGSSGILRCFIKRFEKRFHPLGRIIRFGVCRPKRAMLYVHH